MFRHPQYYKELRKLRNKSDQAISFGTASTDDAGVRPGPGQVTSVKLQATSDKLQASSIWWGCKQQALYVIPIVKRQARRFAMIGYKTVDRGALIKFY